MSQVTDTRLWRDLAEVHRLRFPLPVVYVCHAVWGACYAATEIGDLAAWPVAAVVAANVLLLTAGLALNTLVDVQSDAKSQDKKHLPRAIQRIGPKRVGGWVAIEATVGLALALAVTLETGRWLVLGSAAGILLAHLLYNVEPARLKHRGFVGAIVFGAATPGLPSLLAYCAIRPDLSVETILIFAGIGVLAMGRTAWWSVPDVAADARADAGTPAVRHGAARASALSCAIMFAGLVSLISGLWWRYGPLTAGAGTAAHVVVLLIAVAPFLPRTGSAVSASSSMLRRWVVPLVTVGETTLLVVPLVHLVAL